MARCLQVPTKSSARPTLVLGLNRVQLQVSPISVHYRLVVSSEQKLRCFPLQSFMNNWISYKFHILSAFLLRVDCSASPNSEYKIIAITEASLRVYFARNY